MAADVKMTARRQNKDSKSNGGLMRISPLIVWASDMAKDNKLESYELLKTVIRADCELTHPEKLT